MKLATALELCDFDADGSVIVKKYDLRGNQIEETYLNSEQKPVSGKYGYEKVTFKYDEAGHRVELQGFDAEGSITVKKYDLEGNQIEEAYLDSRQKPVSGKNGYARWAARHDGANHEIERTFYGLLGELRAGKNGVARWTIEYDANGNPVSATHFDGAGKPMDVEVYIAEVLKVGQAHEIGLAVGDVLLSYDKKPVHFITAFAAWARVPGETPRELVIRRAGEKKTLQVKPGLLGVVLDVTAVAKGSQ